MKKIIFCLFCIIICNNSYSQSKKDWRPFIEINFGITSSVLSPNYSISSPYLKTPSYQEAKPSLIFKIGATFKKKHFLAIGIENIQMYNSYSYLRNDNNNYFGSGSTPISPYSGVGLYYDYKVISFKRFGVLASVQTSLGFTEPRKTFNDSTSGGLLSYNSNTGVYLFAYTQEVRNEQKDFIFVYGVGLSCHVELIKEKLILGIGAKFVHAPYAVVKSYHVIYKYMNEVPLDFYTSNSLMNVNFDIRLKYVF